ncbi:MAG: hypothetical protein ACREP8_10240, partial [Candidatus Binatia bacterium]
WASRNPAADRRVQEKTRSLFQPDMLLQVQFYATARSANRLEPEKKLMLAILQDAVYCFQNYLPAKDEKGETIFQEAKDWILETNSNWFLSFENICEELQFHPGYIRDGLMNWKKRMSIRRLNARVYLLRPKIRRKMHGVHGSKQENAGSRKVPAVRAVSKDKP